MQTAPTDTPRARLQTLLHAGDLDEAVRCCQEILARRPGQHGVRVRLAQLLCYTGRLAEATATCRAAPVKLPRLRAIEGLVARQRDDMDAAISALREAAAWGAADAWIWANLASVLEAANHNDDAADAARHALSIAPQHPLASAVLATLERCAGDPAAALRRTEAALQGPVSAQQRAWLLREQGTAHDRLGNTGAAHAAFVDANRLTRELLGAPPADLPARLDAQRARWATRPTGWPARPAATDGFRDPLFVVGFPRSGTSLVREMLDAHPLLRCTDEQPFIPRIAAALGAATPAHIAALPAARIAALRQQYIREATAAYPLAPGQRLVDKLPLNLIHAGLIHRLFPNASFLVLVRDPRDCCLSAFMQAFRSNDAMDCFYTLEDAARLYASVFSLWETLQRSLGLRWQTLRYEDLVEDTEATLRDALAGVGVAWSDESLRYAQRAGRRHIRTPSHQDVRKPIFRRAVARWRRYSRHIAAIEPVLAPHIRAHGYPLSPTRQPQRPVQVWLPTQTI